jgi:hypothetical protein
MTQSRVPLRGKGGINSKKGTGHIEMLLGFTLFVGVILFLFVIMKIGEVKSEDYEFLVEKLEARFVDEVGTDVIKFYVLLGGSPTGCVSLDLNSYNFGGVGLSSAYDGEVLIDSNLQGDVLYVGPGHREFYVYLSDGVSSSTLTGCSPPSSFEIGPIEMKNYLNYSKLEQLSGEYYADYEILGESLGIGRVYDFSIELGIPEVAMNRTISSNVNVYVRRSFLPLVLENGTIELKEVTFKVW